jgi:hypothetical protein
MTFFSDNLTELSDINQTFLERTSIILPMLNSVIRSSNNFIGDNIRD